MLFSCFFPDGQRNRRFPLVIGRKRGWISLSPHGKKDQETFFVYGKKGRQKLCSPFVSVGGRGRIFQKGEKICFDFEGASSEDVDVAAAARF